MKLTPRSLAFVVLFLYLLSNSATVELGRQNSFKSPTGTHQYDSVTAQVHAELSSTGESNIISIDSSGNSYVACGSFNGTLTISGMTSSMESDILLIHQPENAELQVFSVEVQGDGECTRVVHQGNNQSMLVGWFDGTLKYHNISVVADGKAGFALTMNHATGEVIDHYVVDSPISGHADYLYGVDQLEGGGFVVVGSTRGDLSNQSHGKSQASCSKICGILAVLNNSLAVQEFTYASGTEGVVAKDVAQHTVTNALLVIGNYLDDLQFENSSISPPSSKGLADIFVAKYVMGQGWSNSLTVGGEGADVPHSITKSGTNHYISTSVTHDPNHLSFSNGETISSTVGGKDILIIEVDSSGNYVSQQLIGSSGNDFPGDLVQTSGYIAFTGALGGEFGHDDVAYGQSGVSNMLIAKIDLTGQDNDQFFTSSGSNSPDGRGNGITELDNGTIIAGGRLRPTTTYIDSRYVGGTSSTGVVVGLYDDQDNDGIATTIDNCPTIGNADQADLDGDNLGDMCDPDKDDDGIENEVDTCQDGETNWVSNSGTDWDGDGCNNEEDSDDDNDGFDDLEDTTCPRGQRGDGTRNLIEDRDEDGCFDDEDVDDDGDGKNDSIDSCTEPTSVVKRHDWVDNDDDGCHDHKPGEYGEDMNDDNDEFEDPLDDCPNVFGDSTQGKSGCPDSDGDSWANDVDDCQGISGTSSIDRKGCLDSDGDGYSNPDGEYTTNEGADAFPDENSQWKDQDGDGFGDNRIGFQFDQCLNLWGSSLYDRFGCPDSDGDGYSNPSGDWRIEHGADQFVNHPSQWMDSDGDGFGDNKSGFEGDACPSLYGNSTRDQFGCMDTDGDGYSDDGSDAFPDEKSQYMDTDGDGYGDNPTGFEGDACPETHGTSTNDRVGCLDSDDDGYSNPDETWGILQGADAFWNDQTQWSDGDGDGFGDNVSGLMADACPTDPGSSWSDRFGCLDSDEDGRSNPDANWTSDDGADDCPDDPKDECVAYILKHPTQLMSKQGGLVVPVVILAVAVFIKQRSRFGFQEEEQQPDLTADEEGVED